MKFRKIFTFILLLCTIFSTLFIVSPVVYAQNDAQSDIYFSDSIPSPVVLDSDCRVYYEINFTNYWVPLITNENPLPYWVRGVSHFRFKNENRLYDLDLYIYGEYFATLEPGEISNWYPTGETLDIGFKMHTSANPLPPDTFTLNGGFKFNTNFATSNFYSSNIDLNFTNYFPFPYNSNYSGFVNFTQIQFQPRDNTRAGVMYYKSEYGLTTAWTDDLINGLGFWNNYNNPTLITQFIKFNNVVVSESIYDWLNSVGTFGEFDYTDIPDNGDGETPNTSRFQWLINDIDAFMNLEPLPNLSFYDILLVFVSIPLLIYILKLFLGG